MAASTKRPSVGRAPAPARLTEANAAGSGRCSRIVTASPSDGQPRVPTATTACCWNRPSPRSPTGGLLTECETLHLDRGDDNGVVRRFVAHLGIDDLVCSKVHSRGTATTKKLVPLELRWPIERTNSWLSNFGQLRRNTARFVMHRLAQLALAVALLLTAKLIDWTAGPHDQGLSAQALKPSAY